MGKSKSRNKSNHYPHVSLLKGTDADPFTAGPKYFSEEDDEIPAIRQSSMYNEKNRAHRQQSVLRVAQQSSQQQRELIASLILKNACISHTCLLCFFCFSQLLVNSFQHTIIYCKSIRISI